jgi:hypothetical protein
VFLGEGALEGIDKMKEVDIKVAVLLKGMKLCLKETVNILIISLLKHLFSCFVDD